MLLVFFLKASESCISNFLPWTCRHKPLILWKSTAVIGWPHGSQVITLTVDSVAGWGGAGGAVEEEEEQQQQSKQHKMSPKKKTWKIQRGAGNLFFCSPIQQLKGEQKQCWGGMKRLFEAIVFSFEILVGCCPSGPPSAVGFSFPIKEGNKSSFATMDSFQREEKLRPWIVFEIFFPPHLSAVVTDCDFMQTNLIVLLVYWYFLSCFSHDPLQSRCNFCRSVCADMH